MRPPSSGLGGVERRQLAVIAWERREKGVSTGDIDERTPSEFYGGDRPVIQEAIELRAADIVALAGALD